ncbi:hypothetical protein DFH08DRAFT_208777 [Mycena albidolilacea]|uniref:Uncharacterized protein n=1 Tax=Mycena albidolilacea TaxID=1033008 RepID=A0AAD7A0E7_9AGAR|nr:hypothetical protein DFH08DRAFT_208777 [Mycena albidolilacea]
MRISLRFFALAPLVAAFPLASHNVAVARGTDAISPETPETQGNVFVCTNSGFTGTCSVFRGTSGQCIDFTGDFNDGITSVGPDPGQDCFFFTDLGCTGQQLGPVRSPGISNLVANAGFNDQISSFQCFFG